VQKAAERHFADSQKEGGQIGVPRNTQTSQCGWHMLGKEKKIRRDKGLLEKSIAIGEIQKKTLNRHRVLSHQRALQLRDQSHASKLIPGDSAYQKKRSAGLGRSERLAPSRAWGVKGALRESKSQKKGRAAPRARREKTPCGGPCAWKKN